MEGEPPASSSVAETAEQVYYRLQQQATTPLTSLGQAQALLAELLAQQQTLLLENQRLRTTQHALTSSENRLLAAEAVAETGSYELEVASGALHFSAGLCRLLGEAPGSFTPSLAWLDARSRPEDRGVIAQALDQAIRTKQPYRYTRHLRRADGAWRTFEAHGRVVCDAAGAALRLEGVVADQTDRQRPAHALQAAEDSFQLFVTASVDVVYKMSADWRQMYQLAGKEFLADTRTHTDSWLHGYIPAADQPAVVAAIARATETKAFFEHEHRVFRADGTIGWVHSRAVPVCSPAGDLVEWVGTATDITARKEAEQERDRATERLQATLDSSLYVVQAFEAVRDEHGRITDFRWVFINQAAVAQQGDVVGQRLLAHSPGVVASGLFALLVQVTETGAPIDHEYYYNYEQFDGWFHQTLVKLGDGFVMNTEDISERRRAAQELQASRELLRATLDSSLDMIQVFEAVRDEHGTLVDFRWTLNNQVSKKAYGDVIGQRLLVRNPGVVEAGIFDTFKRVVETGVPDQSERHYTSEQFDGWFFQSTVKLRDGVAAATTDISERKRHEQEILRLQQELAHQAENKYRTLFNAIDEGFCLFELLYDAQGTAVDYRFLEVNQVFEQQTGLPDVPGKLGSDLAPGTEPHWLRTYAQVVQTGQSVRFENYHASTGRWYEAYASPVGGAGSRQVCTVFSDVTARKQHEQRQQFLLTLNDALRPLADPREIQRTATRVLGEYFGLDRAMYAEITPDGETVVVTDNYLSGRFPAFTGSFPLSAYGPIIERARYGEPLIVEDVEAEAALTDEEKFNYKVIGSTAFVTHPLLKGGRWVANLVVHQGEPRRWSAPEIALLRETAERTWAAVERARAEEALRQSEEKYRSLFESIDEGFSLMELLYDEAGQAQDYRHLEVNPAHEKMTGLVNVAGRTARETMPGPEAQEWVATLNEVARTGEARRLERYLPSLAAWFDVYTARVGGPGSRLVTSVFNNITARKQHEQLQQYLLQLGDALRPLADPSAVQQAAMQVLGDFLQVSRAFYGDMLADHNTLLIGPGYASGLAPLEGQVSFSAFDSDLVTYYRAGQTVVIHDLYTDVQLSAQARAAFDAIGVRAAVGVPLVKDGQVRAILSIHQAVPRRWTAAELALMAETAERTWAAVERAKTEDALRESEAQLRSFLTASSDTLYRMSADWQQMYSLQGRNFMAPTSAPSETWFMRYIPPADHAAVQLAVQAAIASRGPFKLEHRVFRADGSVGWVFSRATPVLDAQGELVEWFGTATDITARKQAEDALRASEERLRTLVENLPGAAVFVVDAELRYLVAEGDALHQAGLRPADLLGRTVREAMPPALWALHEAHYRAALAGQPFALEHEAHGRAFATRGVPLRHAAGQAPTVLAVSYDITERRQAENALYESEERFRNLVESYAQAVWEAEASGLVTQDSPSWRAYTGQTEAEWLGHGWVNAVHPDDRAYASRQWWDDVAAERDVNTEFRLRYVPDGYRWTNIRATPIRDAQGRIGKWVGMNLDIHARKTAEAALRASEAQLEAFNQHLEQQVAERTHELRESRELLQSAFDTNLIAMSVLHAIRNEAGEVQDFQIRLVNKELERTTGRTDLVGKHYAQEYPGIKQAGVYDLILRTVATGESQGMEYYYEHEGFDRWYSCLFVKLDDGVVATNLDITERKLAEQGRLRTLHLLEQAEAVAGLGSWDYNVLTQEFLWSNGMYQLFGLPLSQSIDPGIYRQFVVAEDQPQAELLAARIAAGSGSFEQTLRLRLGEQVKTVRIRAVVLHDAAGHPVRVLGVDLDISELLRLETENLRLRLSQQQALFEAVQAAEEEERRRMAESLHNGIGQLLYATKLQLDRLPSAPELSPRREAARLLGEAIRQTRTLSHELTPAILEEFGLEATLQSICRSLNTPTLRWHCYLAFEDRPPLPISHQLAIYRLAQELAQNVLKHAHATEATLEVEVLAAWVVLRVEDNGRGFDPALTGDGLGLRTLRSRVALLGGTVHLDTAPGQGTQCLVRFPLTPPAL